MNITLTPEQETLIQSKIQTGKYQSSQDVLDIALKLLNEYELAESEWSREVHDKIEAALSTNLPPIEGVEFVNRILERFNNNH
jgi:antitoxin ParD1/3/4